MTPKLRSTIRHYCYGLVASCWNAAVQSVCVGFGAGMADVTGVADLRSVTPHQILSTVGGTVLLHAFLFFKAHPLPEKLSDVTIAVPTQPPFPKPTKAR